MCCNNFVKNFASPHFGTCGVLVASTNVTWHLNRQWPFSCVHWHWPIEKVMPLIRQREWRLISRIIRPAGLEIPAIRFQTLAPFGRLKLIGRKFLSGNWWICKWIAFDWVNFVHGCNLDIGSNDRRVESPISVEMTTDGVGGSVRFVSGPKGLDADDADYRLKDISGAGRPLRQSSIVCQLTRIGK